FICYFILSPLLAVFAPESTQQLIDPPVRSAIVQQDNRAEIGSAIDALKEFDLAEAEALSQATGIALEQQQRTTDPSPNDQVQAQPEEAAPAPASVRDLLDISVANAL
ncbi:MAG: hypothetical protein GTO41_04680, partial [Burkholderiales bacterium]|nr:hypothetical protein [Burkholderiales bacterium]